MLVARFQNLVLSPKMCDAILVAFKKTNAPIWKEPQGFGDLKGCDAIGYPLLFIITNSPMTEVGWHWQHKFHSRIVFYIYMYPEKLGGCHFPYICLIVLWKIPAIPWEPWTIAYKNTSSGPGCCECYFDCFWAYVLLSVNPTQTTLN